MPLGMSCTAIGLGDLAQRQTASTPPDGWQSRTAGSLSCAFAALLAACAREYPQTTFRPVTDFGTQIDQVFTTVFWWTMVVLVLVEAVLLYVVFRFRQRPGAPPPRRVYGHTGLEILWTLGPAFIIGMIAVPTIRGIFATQRPAPSHALAVEVIGHQWWWEFRYPEYGIVTANQLHLPTDRPIDLRLRSADVIHSFWVPRLGGKRDVNPVPRPREGEAERVNHLGFTIAEPGRYSGQCAEFCGLAHAIMRMLAVAQAPAEFEAWVRSMKAAPRLPPPGSLEEQGAEIFSTHACVACHTIEGTNARGQLGPSLTRLGERWSIGAGLLANTPVNLARWIRHPAALKPGARMPGTTEAGGGLPPTGLTDEEVQAVAAYLHSLK